MSTAQICPYCCQKYDRFHLDDNENCLQQLLRDKDFVCFIDTHIASLDADTRKKKVCPYCDQVFAQRTPLLDHLRSVKVCRSKLIEDPKWKSLALSCEACHKVYFTEKGYRKHSCAGGGAPGNPDSYPCPFCEIILQRREDVTVHIRESRRCRDKLLKDPPTLNLFAVCQKCDDFFLSHSDLKQHKCSGHSTAQADNRLATAVKRQRKLSLKEPCVSKFAKWDCNLCENVFYTRGDLRYHKGHFHARKRAFSMKQDLKTSDDSVDENNVPVLSQKIGLTKTFLCLLRSLEDVSFVCASCDLKLKDVDEVTEHKEMCSEGVIKASCVKCNGRYLPAKFSKHKCTIVQCEFCKAAISKGISLKTHLLTCVIRAEGIACVECGKRFTSIHGHAQHTELCTSTIEYRCSKCGRLFEHRSRMKRHERPCLGDVKHCTKCHYAFPNAVTLNLHMKTSPCALNKERLSCVTCFAKFDTLKALWLHKRMDKCLLKIAINKQGQIPTKVTQESSPKVQVVKPRVLKTIDEFCPVCQRNLRWGRMKHSSDCPVYLASASATECPLCGKEGSLELLFRHLPSCRRNKRLLCSKCQLPFSSIQLLELHSFQRHCVAGDRQVCCLCRTFSWTSLLELFRHIRLECCPDKSQLSNCPFCWMAMGQDGIRDHLNTCLAGLPKLNECPFCKVVDYDEAELKNHIDRCSAVHSRKRPERQGCARTKGWSSQLQQRPDYQCRHCSMVLADRPDLTNHVATDHKTPLDDVQQELLETCIGDEDSASMSSGEPMDVEKSSDEENACPDNNSLDTEEDVESDQEEAKPRFPLHKYQDPDQTLNRLPSYILETKPTGSYGVGTPGDSPFIIRDLDAM